MVPIVLMKKTNVPYKLHFQQIQIGLTIGNVQMQLFMVVRMKLLLTMLLKPIQMTALALQ